MFRIDTEGEIKGQEDDTEEDDAVSKLFFHVLLPLSLFLYFSFILSYK